MAKRGEIKKEQTRILKRGILDWYGNGGNVLVNGTKKSAFFAFQIYFYVYVFRLSFLILESSLLFSHDNMSCGFCIVLLCIVLRGTVIDFTRVLISILVCGSRTWVGFH